MGTLTTRTMRVTVLSLLGPPPPPSHGPAPTALPLLANPLPLAGSAQSAAVTTVPPGPDLRPHEHGGARRPAPQSLPRRRGQQTGR